MKFDVPSPSNVLDLAAFRERKRKRAQPPQIGQSGHGWSIALQRNGRITVTIELDDVFVDYDFTAKDLRSYAQWFDAWARLREARDEAVERVSRGECGYGWCKRKPWRGTGLCRRCAALLIERARGDEIGPPK